MSTRVRIDREGELALVRMTRGEAHNGLDFEMIAQLIAAGRALKKAGDVRGAVLQGEGPSFCAGLDFKSVMKTPVRAAMEFTRLYSPVRNKFQEVAMIWRDLPFPVVACVHGNCFGGGIQLALACDFRVATPDAKLSIMEAKWGLIPDMSGTVPLRELLPMDVAKELVMTGRVLSGEEARALGLVTHVATDPLAKARELLREILTRSPDSVAAGKFLLQEAWWDSEEGALAAERYWQRQLLGSGNQKIAVVNNMKKESRPFGPRKVKK